MSTYFNFKTDKEKSDIKKWITEKEISCDYINIENIINIISCCKTNLNEEIFIRLYIFNQCNYTND